MLSFLGPGGRSCEGLSRRQVLRVGALATLGGATLARPSQTHAAVAGPIKSVILIDLFGGPSHIDMFDLKPAAPTEVRGPFNPIATSVPGLQICEHLPKLAEWMDRVTLIRTLSHGYNSHNPYAVMTGFTGGNDQQDYFSRPTDYPSMGSVCHFLGLTKPGIPPYIVMPALPGYTQSLRRAGPYGGYLGQQYDPLFSTCDPKLDRNLDDKDAYNDSVWAIGDPRLPSLQGELTADLLDRRRTLLEQLDAQAGRLESQKPKIMSHWQQQAFELLLKSPVRNSFQIGHETDATRDRYGRDIFGSSLLMARRLVEAGVTYITVHTESKGNGHWDTHSNNFNMLQNLRLPFVDRSLTALLQDLKDRGLWASTLVVMMGDMGRSPKVNKSAGRDHWPQCGFCFLAGGGVKSGFVLGTSDAQAAYPKDRPVSPGDICATIYHLLGIDPSTMVPDSTNRPHSITHGGQPVAEVLT